MKMRINEVEYNHAMVIKYYIEQMHYKINIMWYHVEQIKYLMQAMDMNDYVAK